MKSLDCGQSRFSSDRAIRATVLDYRNHARRQLLIEYPSIAAEISAQRVDRLHGVR
jgi:hypothetical protein